MMPFMKRLLAAACSILAAGTLTFGTGCSKEGKKTSHLERANEYFAAGDSEKALIEYLNVVRLEPTNQVAVARLAQLHYDRGEYSTAVPLLLRARALSPTNLEVRRRLGQMFLQGGQLEEARAEADAILEVDPVDEDGILILSRTVKDTNELAQVRVRLEELRARTGDKSAIQLALGNLAVRSGDRAAAEAAFQQAVALDPKSSRAKLALGSLYWTRGRTNEAAALFEAAAQQAGPTSPERIRWAQYKLQTGARDEAKQILEAAAKSEPDNTSVGIMLGELALAENNLVECSNRVVKVLRQDPAHYDGLLLQARLLRAQGNHSQSIDVLQRAQTRYASSPQLAFELGVSHLANGNAGEAINRLYGALALEPQYVEANLLLADLQMAQGDPASAATTLQKFQAERPDIPRTQLMLANAYQAQGRLNDALAAVDTYLRMVTNDAAGSVTKGLILRAQTNNVAARQAFEQARQLAPQSEAVLYQLVELDLLDRKYDDAMRRVQAAIQQAPKSPGAAYLQARVHLARNEVAEAETALNKTLELGPNFSLAYSLLLDLYTARGDYAAAQAKLDAFLKQRPGNVGALMMKGMLYDRVGDLPQARASYSAVLATNANVVPALNNLAYLYSEHLNDLDQARPLAVRARELAPQDPGVADTLGWIEYRRGAYDVALPLLQESAGRMPDEAEVQYHLGMARYMTGQEAAAREALARALELSTNFTGRTNAQQYLALLSADTAQPPETLIPILEKGVADRPQDTVAWQRLAALYVQTGATDKARNAYEQVLRINPKAAPAMAGLAQLYAGPLRQPAKALELARQARNLAPADPAIAHTLGRVAFQAGDFAWANSLLSEAARLDPDRAEVLFDYGLAAYSQGRVDESRQAIQRALERNSAFGQAGAAKQFLALTVIEETPAQAPQLEAAARNVPEQHPAHVPALMVLARAVEQAGQKAEARQAYERILTIYSAFTPAMKRIAIVLAELGTDDAKAVQIGGKAREADPQDAELAKALGKVSLRRGDARYAAQLLEESARSRATDGDVWYSLGLARLQLGQKEPGKAALEKALELEPQGAFAADAKLRLTEE